MKAKISVFLIFLSAIIFSSSAGATMKAKTYSISPFIGGYTFEGNEDLDTSPLLGIRLGYNMTSKCGLEGVFTYLNTDYENAARTSDVNAYGYRLETFYKFMEMDGIDLLFAAGLGGRSLDFRDLRGDKDQFLLDYGLTLQYFLSDNLALRGDLRHLILFADNYNNLEYTLGLTYYFGSSPQPAPVIAPAVILDTDNDGVPDNLDKCPDTPRGVGVDQNGCPLDTDQDGVPDYLDKCPNTPMGIRVDGDGCPLDMDKDGVADYLDKCPGTPKGVAVDSNGCPMDTDQDGVPDYLDKCPDTPRGARVDGNGCPLDADGDGVPDYLDKCPGTPTGVTVDAIGCPLDTDKDGVPDYLDKCPDTPAGDKVDADGCSLKGRTRIDIEFETNKADIRPMYHAELKKLADIMIKYPDINVVIEGHTDNVGGEGNNLELSQARANSVKNYLEKEFGIEESRLTAKGFGESKPIASNETAAGRQQNRRVEAVVSYTIKK